MPQAPAATKDFAFRPQPPIEHHADAAPAGKLAAGATATLAPAPDPLAWASGTWTGTGFNTIWRPFFGGAEDEFLELDLTAETLDFREVAGEIPNRGFAQPDIVMHGVAYTDQISDSVTGAGLHLEPGLWIAIPSTTAPHEPATVARLASIPHGTTVLAQGVPTFLGDQWPTLPATNIVPFDIGKRQPRNADADFAAKLKHAKKEFPQMVLAKANQFRLPAVANPAGMTQAVVDDPTLALEGPPAGATFQDTVRLHVTTVPRPVPGGGDANTAFLKVNADAVRVVATFQQTLVHPAGGGAPYRWLQYVQSVLLDFDDLSWPHVTVGSLTSPV